MPVISLNLPIRQVHDADEGDRVAVTALQRSPDVPFVPNPYPNEGLLTRDSDLGEGKIHQREKAPWAVWIGREYTPSELTSLFHPSRQRGHPAKAGRTLQSLTSPIRTGAQALDSVAL